MRLSPHLIDATELNSSFSAGNTGEFLTNLQPKEDKVVGGNIHSQYLQNTLCNLKID